MTTDQDLGSVVPQWTQGDRLRKARVLADLTVHELAQRTGISEKTVNNYEADRHSPRRPSLIAWALATDVSLEWLTSGEAVQSPTPTPPGQPGDDRKAALARLAARKRPHGRASASSQEYLGRAA